MIYGGGCQGGEKMRKALTILGLFFIILVVIAEFVLPGIVRGTLRTKAEGRLATSDVTVTVDSAPAALLALGEAQALHIAAHQAKVGDVTVQELTLDGKGVRLDVPALVHGEGIRVRRADALQIRGIISEDNLREAIAAKIDRLEDVAVKISPDGVLATARVKLFGRKADVELEGDVVEDGGALYFRMSRLNVRNALIGTAKLSDMFGSFELAPANKLPFGLKLQSVTQKDGRIVLVAERRKDKD